MSVCDRARVVGGCERARLSGWSVRACACGCVRARAPVRVGGWVRSRVGVSVPARARPCGCERARPCAPVWV